VNFVASSLALRLRQQQNVDVHQQVEAKVVHTLQKSP
jgi:hypothetical protein